MVLLQGNSCLSIAALARVTLYLHAAIYSASMDEAATDVYIVSLIPTHYESHINMVTHILHGLAKNYVVY